MPNHVTNILTFKHAKDLVDIVPEQPGRSYDNHIRYVQTDEQYSYGFLNEATGKFWRQGQPEVDGVPEGYVIDMMPAHIVFDFAKIVPPPDDPAYRDEPNQETAKESPNWWYIWNCNNWGTKWNAYDAELRSDTELKFATAWSVPEPVIAALSLKYPDEEILIESIDEGWNFACSIVFRNGVAESCTEYSCDRDSEDFVELYERVMGFRLEDEEPE